MDNIYDLITLHKDEIVKIIPNPKYGQGAFICDTSCALEINYAPEPIPLDDIKCHIDPIKKYIKINIKNTDNHIIYKGANSAVNAGYIKADNNVISDKYILQDIYIFLYVRNHIDGKTSENDFEIQLIHKSSSDVMIATVVHIKSNTSDSVQSTLYETLFDSIVQSDIDQKMNEAPYDKTMADLCNNKNSTCMTSVITDNFIIDNTVDPLFYSWLDLKMGYKLYWISFDKNISISSSIFNSIKKYMNKDIDQTITKQIKTPIYITPVIGELIYYKIGDITYNRRHYLYISLGGTELPDYAQSKYGKRPDKPSDDPESKKCKNNDNLIVVNAPQNEKIVIEVDNKIKESFTNIKHRLLDIKESFSTINIKEVSPGNPPNINTSKNIIICVLAGIIILYILFRVILYCRNKQVLQLTYISMIFSYLKAIPAKIWSTIFKSTDSVSKTKGGEIDNSLSSNIDYTNNNEMNKVNEVNSSSKVNSSNNEVNSSSEVNEVNSSFNEFTTSSKTKNKTKLNNIQMGGGKYKIGLKKIKRKLI